MTNEEINSRSRQRLAFAISCKLAEPTALVMAWPIAEGDALSWNVFHAYELPAPAFDAASDAAEWSYARLCERVGADHVNVVSRPAPAVPFALTGVHLTDIPELEYFNA